jgi:hypothetical protein
VKFTYQDTEYDLVEPVTWTTIEAIRLERATGLRTGEIMAEFSAMEPVGIHSVLWVSLLRSGVDLAWDALELPYIDTMNSFHGAPVEEPPDPSTASTAAPKAAPRSPSARARSQKK